MLSKKTVVFLAALLALLLVANRMADRLLAGRGPVGVSDKVVPFLHIPRVSGFHGNFGIILRAYAYILMLGREHIKLAGKLATLGANYIKESLKDCYKLPIPTVCKHEFVFDGLVDDGAARAADGHGDPRLLHVAHDGAGLA